MTLRVNRRFFLLSIGTLIAVVVTSSVLLPSRSVRALLKETYLRSKRSLAFSTISSNLKSLSSLDDSETFDVCIIGSGPAGAALGRSLAENGFRIVLLESGHFFDAQTQEAEAKFKTLEIYQSRGAIDYPVAKTRVRALGGTFNTWTGNCDRYQPIDFEKNSFTPEGLNWPVSYAELQPYYNQSEQDLKVAHTLKTEYYPPIDPKPSQRPSDAFVKFQEFFRNSTGLVLDDSPKSGSSNGRGTVRVAEDWLPELSSMTSIASDATVTRLINDDQGNIIGAETHSIDGTTKTIKARQYVVACGGLESARLLLLSKSSQFPNGIGNNFDNVGRYFNEHPSLQFFFTLPDSPLNPPSAQGRSHQFYGEFKKKGLGGILLIASKGDNNRYRIGATLEMKPIRENRVVLDSSLKDAFGNPGLALSFDYAPEDLKTIDETRALLRKMLNDLGAQEIEEEDIHWSHHHMGTCLMGDDLTRSVVDRNLRVHDTSNLYVLSSAVFTTGGAAHPTPLLLALGYRLAEHLKEELSLAKVRGQYAANDQVALQRSLG